MTQTTINISQASRQSVKIFVIVQIILCVIFCPLLIIEGIDMIEDVVYLGILAIGGGLFFIYVVAKQFKPAFEKEYIVLDGNTLTINRQHIFGSNSEHFPIVEIISIAHVGHRQYTKHPMENNVIDFTGLAANEKYVQTIVDDGTMEIISKDKVIRFGKNIPSWDAEQIISQIEKKTKRRLRTK